MELIITFSRNAWLKHVLDNRIMMRFTAKLFEDANKIENFNRKGFKDFEKLIEFCLHDRQLN